ncbi:hypothetical protein ACFVH7_32625 [Kitasatospora indigofera]|uniref:hypothetical protein n=1 Tax=Kitasatospora indigofera TaxID=67307 RepID=UPI00167EACDA|nr:hypothetical protein [Kitasatospora indigofera]
MLANDGPIVKSILRARWVTLSAVLADLAAPDFPPLPFVRPELLGVEPAAGRFGLRVLPGGAGGDRLDFRHGPDEEVGEAQDNANTPPRCWRARWCRPARPGRWSCGHRS